MRKQHDDLPCDITRKRRKSFPSESRVKRGHHPRRERRGRLPIAAE